MSNIKLNSKNPTPHSSRGLTLVELMVAVVVSLILFSGIAQIFVSNKRAYRVQDDNSNIQENARFATGMIAQDLRRAGYYGGNSNVQDISGTQAVVAATNTCPANNSWARMLLTPIVGSDNTNANYACIPNANYNNGSDILVTRYTGGANVTAATMALAANANRLYIRSSLFEGRMFLGSQAANATNAVTETPQVTQQLVAHAYYVGPTGRFCPDGTAILSLFREELDNNAAPNRQEIATNVENLQIQYGIDTNDDLNTDQYLDANNIANWTQVVAVRYWILVRSQCMQPGNYINPNTYTMGNVNFIPNDAYKRQLYTGTVSLRN